MNEDALDMLVRAIEAAEMSTTEEDIGIFQTLLPPNSAQPGRYTLVRK